MGARDDLLAIPDDLLRNGSIAEAVLCWMDFSTGAKRWWAGFGPLVWAGHEWLGTGDVFEISALTSDYQMSAEPLTISLAATPEMVLLAKNSKTAVSNRTIVVYSQLFATTQIGAVGPWQPLIPPVALFSGTMSGLTFAADGAQSRMISLNAEGLLTRRNAPPRGLLTDSDQQARHAGDKGLERVSLYTQYETRWI